MTRDERKEMWLERVQQFKDSGETAADWSQSRGISVHTLRYWLRKQPKDSTPPEWIVFDFDNMENQSVATLSVHVGKVTIEVPENFNHQLLSEIVEVLQGTC